MTAKEKYSCYLHHHGMGASGYNYTEEQCLQALETAIAKNDYKDKPKYDKTVWQMLHCACDKGYISVVKRLLTAPNLGINNARNNRRLTLLLTAVYANQTEVILLLLTHPKINVNKYGGCYRWALPFSFAVYNNNIEVVKAFLAHPRLDINKLSRVNTPSELNRFLYGDDEETTRSWGKRISVFDIAIKNNRKEIIELLLERSDSLDDHWDSTRHLY